MSETFTLRVAELFRSKPNQWISAYELMEVGGSMAWRSRISNARLKYGMAIENKVDREPNGVAHSYYRFVPQTAVGQQSFSL